MSAISSYTVLPDALQNDRKAIAGTVAELAIGAMKAIVARGLLN
ncbi:MAG: hypothetical protein WA435_11035 [Gallionellaceae bacterium]